MRSIVGGLLAVLWCCLAGLQPAAGQAGKRVALVIGNGTYQKAAILPNPARDAAAMGAMLKATGFDTAVMTDLGLRAMQKALREMSVKARSAEIAVVFYAGHGIEVDGMNYVLPVDAALERDLDVKDETVSLERITELMDGARLRVVILDACRDNPFLRTIKRTSATRSVGRGLARVDAGADTLIAFAAKHGSTAADGTGANSPYTAALLKHLPTPGLDLRLALGLVRDEVLNSTGNEQEPFVYHSLGGKVVALVPASATGAPLAAPKLPPPPPTAPALSEAASEWQSLDKGSIPELETFVRRHSSSPEADYARARLEDLRKDLRKKQAALAEPGPLVKPGPVLPDPRGFSDPLSERDRLAAELSSRRFARAYLAQFDCDTLWFLRNSVFARHGYRFKTARGQQVFGTAGTVDNPRLSAVEEDNVTEILAVERMKACR